MNVLMISPGFPDEMPNFTRGLAEVGARVFGVGDQHPGALPEEVRAALSDYLRVDSLWEEEAVVDAVRKWLSGRQLRDPQCSTGNRWQATVAPALPARVCSLC